MWLIVALLLIFFALAVLGKIAEMREMRWVFLFLAMVVWFVIVEFSRNVSEFGPVLGLALLSVAVSDLIKVPIWRRRVVPPCVRVKGLGHILILNIILTLSMFLFIAWLIYSLVTDGWHPFRMTVSLGLLTVAGIIWFILILFEKVEICGNGLWQNWKLQPWDRYKSFSWKQNTTDRDELRLVPKSELITSNPTRLLVPPEDRETVQHILEPHLPELTIDQ